MNMECRLITGPGSFAEKINKIKQRVCGKDNAEVFCGLRALIEVKKKFCLGSVGVTKGCVSKHSLVANNICHNLNTVSEISGLIAVVFMVKEH